MPNRQHGVTADSPDRLIIDQGAVYFDYGLAGQRLIGATRGGNEFDAGISLRDMDVDGAKGGVKGFRRIEEVRPTLTCNLLEMTKQNLIDAIIGGEASSAAVTAVVDNEFLGSGDGTTTDFTTDQTPIVEGSTSVYVTDTGAGSTTLQVEGTDYTVTEATGTISFTTAPASGEEITIDYTYETGASATHDTLTMAEVTDSDYFSNVAILGELTGDESQSVIVKVLNPIITSSLGMSFSPNDEVVPSLNFEGNYDPSDLEAHPFEIDYPIQ